MNLASTTLDLSSLATSQIATWDIETELIPDTGLKDIKRIFCINVKVNDQPIKRFTKLYHPTSSGNLKGALKLINSCDFNVGHNILGFDIPVVENLVGEVTSYPLDTLIIAKLMFSKDSLFSMDKGIEGMSPSEYGNFSLKAFGHRFGDSAYINLDNATIEDTKKLCELLGWDYEKIRNLSTQKQDDR